MKPFTSPLPIFPNSAKLIFMRNLTAIIHITLVLLLGSAGMSWSADLQKGFAAAKRGDFATALREWKPLAKQGNADAQYNLGVMYRTGDGVSKDNKAAAKWYTRAAEQGHASAQYNLGTMYDNGQGVPQDYKAAVKWCRLAAEQGYALAQYNLGTMYQFGHGVIQDNIYAHMWYNIAASSGDKDAVKNRGIIAKRMPRADISAAQKLARECVRKRYKEC